MAIQVDHYIYIFQSFVQASIYQGKLYLENHVRQFSFQILLEERCFVDKTHIDTPKVYTRSTGI